MAIKIALRAAALAATISISVISVSLAQGMGSGMMQGGMGPGMMQDGTVQAIMGNQNAQSTPRSGATQGPTCSGMMCDSDGSCPCMQDGASRMMRSGIMHRGMDAGMMRHDMHGPGMIRSGAGSGMGALFGSRVVRTLNLSVDDVRNYLNARLEHLDNKRLKLGDVKAEDSTVTADIVTVDNSLVQRLKVDRHTGDIKYDNSP